MASSNSQNRTLFADEDTPPSVTPAAMRGRPAMLSADAIVDIALKLLDAHPGDELTMARIARELSVSPPALYRYFPTRTALLAAMSAAVFADFPDMPADRPWREQLLAWQNHVANLYESHHGVMKLMGWDDQLAGPWLKVQAPVVELLHRMGLKELALVETASWFLAATVGLIGTYYASESEVLDRSDMVALDEGVADLTPTQRALVEESRKWIRKADPHRTLNKGFQALLDGVERELDEAAAG
ncbi:TetR family transcriptional regulator [Sphingomonas sp. MM-1]|uniref:TetR/AcrR family transcriptional regulator n=1 Tax=Sphingomonas sp. MM-1 TaxID=745310 RepID=UPI0002C08BFB|nr:TetR/AcrR family transcriptional regulator [Sphingomonas sp. MM-1]AGH48809.1 TetR family transcriptional regulator [Sphingomonas sp. MM-1]